MYKLLILFPVILSLFLIGCSSEEINVDSLTKLYQTDLVKENCQGDCKEKYDHCNRNRCNLFENTYQTFVKKTVPKIKEGRIPFDDGLKDDFAILGAPLKFCQHLCLRGSTGKS